MKVICTFFLAFTVLMGQAMAHSNLSLKAAFDDLNYALEVKWDQEDVNFHKAQTDLFLERISKLYEEGLTKNEMIEFVISEAKDQRVSSELKELFSMLNANILSEKAAFEMIQSLSHNSYSTGSSWNGRARVAGLAVFVVAATVVAVVLKTKHDTAKNSVGNIR